MEHVIPGENLEDYKNNMEQQMIFYTGESGRPETITNTGELNKQIAELWEKMRNEEDDKL